jgi:cellulose biosynthesis protein BcsQ
MKIIVFFNNKGGVGKTTLVYHVAWMLAELGVNVIAADLDPQANLTSMFLDEDRLEEVWPDGEHPMSILGAIRPILRGLGDIAPPSVEPISERLGLLIGDLGLSGFEDKLSDSWPRCRDGDESAFRVISVLFRVIKSLADSRGAEVALMDVGPNLGAINRAAVIAANYITIPLGPDLYSIQGLRNLGPTLRKWRGEWRERLKKNPVPELDLPGGEMEPVGYVIMSPPWRGDKPLKAYGRWINRIPGEYRVSVLAEPSADFQDLAKDPHCLAMLKPYKSLMPMAMEARKPMFKLKPADGAIGSHAAAAQDCFEDFKKLAMKIANQCRISLP